MSKKGTYIIIWLIALGGIYFLSGYLFKPVLHVDISLRSMHSGSVELRMTDQMNEKNIQVQPPFLLNASQFFTQKNARFERPLQFQNLMIRTDSNVQELFIQSIQAEWNIGFIKRWIGEWKGSGLGEILSDQTQLIASNESFAQIKTLNKDISLNDQFFNQMRESMHSMLWILFLRWLTAILFAFFLASFFMQLFTLRNIPARKKLGHLSISAYGFLSLLIIFLLNSLFKWIPDKVSHENRTMASLNDLNNKTILEYPAVLSAYADDHFAFRNLLFSAHSVFKAKLFRTASLPDQVIMGKNGWFFKNDPYAIRDARKINQFTQADIDQMVFILKERLNWLNQRGIRYYIIVPPNHDRIYRENFPDKYSIVPNYGHDRLDYYKKILQEKLNFTIVDPTDSLMKYKLLYDVYFSTDTHWNLFGAWVGYRNLMDQIRKDFPNLTPVEFHQLSIRDSFTNRGDLSAMLGMEEVYKRKEYLIDLKIPGQTLNFPQSAEMIFNNVNEHTIDSSQLKLMVFRDSYSNDLMPFLNLHFREAKYVWSYAFMPDLVEDFKPDIVILEVQQRAMINAFHVPNLFQPGDKAYQ